MKAIKEMYTQGEQVIQCKLSCHSFFMFKILSLTPVMAQPEATWAFTVLGYIGKLIFGVVG
jgi:hypothetical protein